MLWATIPTRIPQLPPPPTVDLGERAAAQKFHGILAETQAFVAVAIFWNISRNLTNWPREVVNFLEIFQKFDQGQNRTIFARNPTTSPGEAQLLKVYHGGWREWTKSLKNPARPLTACSFPGKIRPPHFTGNTRKQLVLRVQPDLIGGQTS